MRARQIDVAMSAGVTRSVVSHVLHGGSGSVRVSAETAERVRQVAKRLGYSPNVGARNLRRQKTDQIGILHGDGFPRLRLNEGSRYFSLLLEGIIDGAFDNGYAVAMCPKLFSAYPNDSMADGRFDGLVWYSTFPSESNIERLKNCSIPIVLIHSKACDFDNRIPTVLCDNEGGIRLAMEHLAGLGHRNLGFASVMDCVFSEADIRREAFLKIGREMGLEVSLIDLRSDASGLHEYIGSGLRHTGIIAHNEQLAVDMMTAFKRVGIRVPQDVSIIGFDSTDYCNLQEPKLTAISQPISSLGYRAVEVLAKLIADKDTYPIESVLDCRLDVRGSTSIVNEEIL